ncbi:uncharacterized protein V6R79_011992 [Siganus canaliculatus]
MALYKYRGFLFFIRTKITSEVNHTTGTIQHCTFGAVDGYSRKPDPFTRWTPRSNTGTYRPVWSTWLAASSLMPLTSPQSLLCRQYFQMRRNRFGKEDWVHIKWQPGQITHTYQQDATSCGVFVMQVTYADVVKGGCDRNDPHITAEGLSVPHADSVSKTNDSVAGPSRAASVNPERQPSEQSVCASRSQADKIYGRNRNKQCTCNSLTFLGFLHENENLTREDLNLVLDKGNDMYTEVRKRVPNYVYLTTDELPDVVPAHRYVQFADMTHLSKYGMFGEPLPGAVPDFREWVWDYMKCNLVNAKV